MLFYPLKEQFYLPAGFIESGNAQCRQEEVVGEENKILVCLLIDISYFSKLLRILSGGVCSGLRSPGSLRAVRDIRG